MTKCYDIPAPGELVEFEQGYTETEPDVIVELEGGGVIRVRSVRGLTIEVRDLDSPGDWHDGIGPEAFRWWQQTGEV